MVKLEEVIDEELDQNQAGPIGGEDDWDTDSESGSDASSIASVDEDDDVLSESLYDRFVALQDMLPPTQRRFVANTVSTTSSWVKTGLGFSGKALWVVSTSMLLLGVPWALAYAEEQQMMEMEREMQMQQQANALLTQPSNGAPAGDAKAAL